MFKYSKSFESIMNKLLIITIMVVMVSCLVGTTTMMGLSDSYATKQSKQVPPEKTTVQPERQSQQPSAAPGATTVPPERQSQQPSEAPESQRQTQSGFEPSNPAEQQEDENNVIDQKDEQIRDVQEEEGDDENNGDNGEQIERAEIDKKAPIAISGDNVFIVWFNDQNAPNNNSEILFRSSADGGITFADKINLSNTTAADSINAEIAADGRNVIVTWWEHNATSVETVVRASTDSGATFGPILSLSANGTIGETAEEG
jgi:hypothetical protein